MPARHLVFHGAIVLLVGLLCGAPYGRAINRNAPAHTVQAWRVAHGSLPIGALLMFSTAALLPSLRVGATAKGLIALSFTASAYAFCIALPLAAVVGHRGLSSAGPAAAKVVFAFNSIGAWTSLAGTLVLIYAAFMSL